MHEPSSREFAGRRPWGLDAMGADVGSAALCFDHGIRRSPAEKLISKGYSVPHRCKRSDSDAPEQRFGEYRYRISKAGTIRLLSYGGSAARVDIPESIDGVRVVSLATNLFRDHAEIERVSMPDSIEHAGNHVFDGCTGLKNVVLSAALAEVNPTMFLNCTSLTEVVLANPVVRLEGNSFSDAPIECVVFGPLVRAVDAKPLGLPNLKRIRLDAGNDFFYTDGRALFSERGRRLCRLVVPSASYDVPEGCEVIDERAFDSVSELEHVGLPCSLASIGRMAFAKTHLSSVQFPSSLESIGEKAFFHCSKLVRADMPYGLKRIGAEAFAFSAVSRIELPPTLEQLGFRAFDHTPAQAHATEGSLRIAPENPELDLDDRGGLYRHDTFVELIGQVERYRVRSGTRLIADGAFKRHGKVQVVELPEGVSALGCGAFQGNRQLTRVDLPESLECIGENAFLDTSIKTLRISKNVRVIESGALLAQGGNQLMPRTPLAALDLDPENPFFYLESGLFCQRNGARAGGDACILYVGPDSVVRIPDRVTHIANLAFCGADGVDELYVHGHLKSICAGAFSTARTIAQVHVEFPEPIDGYASGDFPVPELSARYRSPSYLFDAGPSGTVFDFDYYDSWATHATSMSQFAPAALYRLMHPMRLPDATRELYEGIIVRKARSVCRYFAEQGDLDALVWLSGKGLLDAASVEAELNATSREGRTQATACLLELHHRSMPSAGVDFSL